MDNLHFRTNAKVESLVGRDLITNNTIAIFELIKNSYDAGARNVNIKFVNFLPNEGTNSNKLLSKEDSYIVIADDGKGMSLDEIRQYWMELGTPYKEGNRQQEVRLRENEIEKIINRVVNGEKGIGRFGVDKIGSKLRLISIDQNRIEKTTVKFDWDKFNDRNKLIEEIPIEYDVSSVSDTETSGLKLIISGLRDGWSSKDIEHLKKNLKKFLSPLKINQDIFRIFFSYGEVVNKTYFKKTEEIVNDTFDYLKTSIKANLEVNGNCNYVIEDNGFVIRNETFKMYPSGSPIGAINVTIYYLDTLDKKTFTSKMGMRTSDYGNIKIFRDNFRVMPYGEPENDWLQIDKKHAQKYQGTFGTRDLVGYILLSHNEASQNHVLREATDRVGLIEDTLEFSTLKAFTTEVLILLQNYIFNRFKEESKENTEVVTNKTINLQREAYELVSSFKEFVSRSNNPQEEKMQMLSLIDKNGGSILNELKMVETASKELKRQFRVYSHITQTEGFLYQVLHEIKNKIAILEAQKIDFEQIIKQSNINYSTEIMGVAIKAIRKLASKALNKVTSSKLEKKKVQYKKLLNELIQYHMPLLRQHKIAFENLSDSNIEEVYLVCSKDSLLNVFDNLFNNSIKALSSIENKKIGIYSTVHNNTLRVFFSDNGIGIPENKRPFIFSLYTSSAEQEGSGIGLAASKDTVIDHGGQLLLIEDRDESMSTTFLITLPLA